MATPAKGIPRDLLGKATCVAIIPGEEKAAFIFGGNYGKGLASCRIAGGWSAPIFVTVGGGVTVAAGPVGRQASANTDLRLNAEILSYSRARVFLPG